MDASDDARDDNLLDFLLPDYAVGDDFDELLAAAAAEQDSAPPAVPAAAAEEASASPPPPAAPAEEAGPAPDTPTGRPASSSPEGGPHPVARRDQNSPRRMSEEAAGRRTNPLPAHSPLRPTGSGATGSGSNSAAVPEQQHAPAMAAMPSSGAAAAAPVLINGEYYLPVWGWVPGVVRWVPAAGGPALVAPGQQQQWLQEQQQQQWQQQMQAQAQQQQQQQQPAPMPATVPLGEWMQQQQSLERASSSLLADLNEAAAEFCQEQQLQAGGASGSGCAAANQTGNILTPQLPNAGPAFAVGSGNPAAVPQQQPSAAAAAHRLAQQAPAATESPAAARRSSRLAATRHSPSPPPPPMAGSASSLREGLRPRSTPAEGAANAAALRKAHELGNIGSGPQLAHSPRSGSPPVASGSSPGGGAVSPATQRGMSKLAVGNPAPGSPLAPPVPWSALPTGAGEAEPAPAAVAHAAPQPAPLVDAGAAAAPLPLHGVEIGGSAATAQQAAASLEAQAQALPLSLQMLYENPSDLQLDSGSAGSSPAAASDAPVSIDRELGEALSGGAQRVTLGVFDVVMAAITKSGLRCADVEALVVELLQQLMEPNATSAVGLDDALGARQMLTQLLLHRIQGKPELWSALETSKTYYVVAGVSLLLQANQAPADPVRVARNEGLVQLRGAVSWLQENGAPQQQQQQQQAPGSLAVIESAKLPGKATARDKDEWREKMRCVALLRTLADVIAGWAMWCAQQPNLQPTPEPPQWRGEGPQLVWAPICGGLIWFPLPAPLASMFKDLVIKA